MIQLTPNLASRPARWRVVLAFSLVYLSWGTTFLAIRKGVETFPPALFSGTRVALAGILLLGYMAWRGQPLRLGRKEFLWTWLISVLMFVGGNGLLSFGEQRIESGLASVLAATSPLWVALLEMLWPWGDRLRPLGWLGLLAGLGGVMLLLAPGLRGPTALWREIGPLFILGSALSWAIGSFLVRHRRLRVDHLASASYQMILGGGSLCVLGLFLGEGAQVEAAHTSPAAVYAFIHLLVFGSLVGFVAYNWLLNHVSSTLAGTYAYVNPLVAILVGWLVGGERITGWIVAGMGVILLGVALVRSGVVPPLGQGKPGTERHQRSRARRRAPVTNRD
jgi:drug/metabolite transporter (DMT)-like permease